MPRMTRQNATSATTGAPEDAPREVPDAPPLTVPKSPVGQRLERLFEETRRPDGQLWTISYLAEELKARGQDVSRQYLGALMTGDRGEPRISLVEAIADVFGLPVAYFTGDYLGRAFAEALPVLLALRDPNVAAMHRRADLHQVAAALASGDLLTKDEVVEALRPQGGSSVLEERLAALTQRDTGDQG